MVQAAGGKTALMQNFAQHNVTPNRTGFLPFFLLQILFFRKK
jgi:hypothetical protein